MRKTIFLAAALVFFGTIGAKAEDALSGSYVGSCQNNGATDSQLSEIKISPNREITYVFHIYHGLNCSIPQYDIAESGTYEIGPRQDQLSDHTFRFSAVLKKKEFTLLSQQLVTIANFPGGVAGISGPLCGISDWKNGESREITNLKCKHELFPILDGSFSIFDAINEDGLATFDSDSFCFGYKSLRDSTGNLVCPDQLKKK